MGIKSQQLRWYKAVGVAVPSFLTYAVVGTIMWPYTGCMYVLDDVEQCSLGMIPNESGSFMNNAFCKIDEELNPLGPGRCDSHEVCQGSRTCGADGYCMGEHMCNPDKDQFEDSMNGKSGQPVASAAQLWCNEKEVDWEGNPWDLFQKDITENEQCQYYAPEAGSTGEKNGCNYYERAWNSCYHAEKKTTEESFCECAMNLAGAAANYQN